MGITTANAKVKQSGNARTQNLLQMRNLKDSENQINTIGNEELHRKVKKGTP